MLDFGGKLREARERAGVSLRQIAATTKISVPALEALERNDISRLPGGIFSRAIVRSYALEVGLDPEATVREFLERFHAVPGLDPPQVDADLAAADQQKHHAARVFLIALAMMLLVGSIVAYVVYQWRPAAAVDPLIVDRPTAVVPPSDSPDIGLPPPPPAADSPSAPVEDPATLAADVRLELHPTAPCWAKVVVEGKQVLSRLFAAGERETVLVKDTAVLTVGDAAACAFSINGRPARPLGASGQVRSARISQATIDEYLD